MEEIKLSALEEIEHILSTKLTGEDNPQDKLEEIQYIIDNYSKLNLKTIRELTNKHFIVPSYQRGYKWKKQQVLDLLNDIEEFSCKEEKTESEFYCLQPIVVMKNDEKWDVIDGQQRLTTIYLILKYLVDEEFYSLDYETRGANSKDSSQSFLTNITSNSKSETIDEFHFVEAYRVVEGWFEKKGADEKKDWKETLLNDTKIIWYIVDNKTDGENIKNSIDVFMRLNNGKIPLTNSEMIRALFLLNCFDKSDTPEVKVATQQKLATEWDNLERDLKNDDFWNFITLNSPFKKEYPNRIEYLLDLIEDGSHKDHEDKYSTYRMYEKWVNCKGNEERDRMLILLEEPRENTTSQEKVEIEKLKIVYGKWSKNKSYDVSSLWLEIKQLYWRFDEWYSDNEIYHLVGFCLTSQLGMVNSVDLSFDSMNSLRSLANVETEKNLKKILKNYIFKGLFLRGINETVDLIHFEKDDVSKKGIRNILLLFNVLTKIQQNKSYNTNNKDNYFTKFRFKTYLNENWDIEHIRSQNEKPQSEKKQKEWVNQVIDVIGKEEFTRITSSGDKSNSTEDYDHIMDGNSFDDKFDKIRKEFGENDTGSQDIDTHTLGNLTLLDSHTNRSYGCSIFPVKRSIILDQERKGVFIPSCTLAIFTKSYNKYVKRMMFWDDKDAKNYQDKMIKVLTTYF